MPRRFSIPSFSTQSAKSRRSSQDEGPAVVTQEQTFNALLNRMDDEPYIVAH